MRRDGETARTVTLHRTVTTAGTPSDAPFSVHVVMDQMVTTMPAGEGASVVVGRGTDVDISIEHPSISRKHARLVVGPHVVVEDLGSTNGIRIQGERVPKGGRVEIQPGVLMDLGGVMLVVQKTSLRAAPRRVWSHGYFEGRVEEECSAGRACAVLHLRTRSSDDVAARVSGVLRPADILATYAPMALEILLVDCPAELARELRDKIEAASREADATATVGLACFPRDARSPDALLAAARATDAAPRSRPTSGPRAFGEAMEAIARDVERVARGDIAILVTGETGAGKELVAEIVHAASPRAKGPLARVNCGGFDAGLLASELFGHERGAFTGADRAKEGLFESADGGTLFLDEIGEMPLDLQPKLLRVLEDKVVKRVGATRERRVDVRIVSATNRDLEVDVAAGRFRADLYFRLAAHQVRVPPLRERRADILVIAEGMLAATGRHYTLDPQAASALERYDWPGNVRELRNVLERAALLAEDDLIELMHLPMEKLAQTVMRPPPTSTPPGPLREALATHERQQVLDALAACGGNQTRAAKMLGIARGTLIARMESYGMARPRKR